jgi:hypothetical protein
MAVSCLRGLFGSEISGKALLAKSIRGSAVFHPHRHFGKLTLSSNCQSRLSKLAVRLSCLLLVTLCTLPLYAQVTAVGITGTVRDPAGNPVSGANVVALDLATGEETKTNTADTGVYLISNGALQLGNYSLTVTAPGFRTWRNPNIQMVTGQVLTYDVNLVLGSVNETVDVISTADHLDTTTSVMGTTTTSDEIQNLPLELGGSPRSSLAFLATMSAISTGNTTNSNDKGNFGGAAIAGSGGNGSSQSYAGYTIDGMSAATRYFIPLGDQYTIVPDAIQELRLASNFNAESAWNSGAEASLITKSGTNHFHGSVYEYFGNNVLDSKNYFATQASSERQNEFGFTLGGPIRKGKTFFYASLDFYRYTNTAAGIVGTVPTAAMQMGDFSQLLGGQIGTDALGRPIYSGEIYDPSTTRTVASGAIVRDPFDCNGVLNTICPAQFSSVSKFLQAGYPNPTLPGTQNNWVGAAAPSPLKADKLSIRIDHQFDQGKQTLLMAMDGDPVYNPGITGIPEFKPLLTPTINDPYRFYRGRLGYNYTITPSLLYNFYITGSYIGSSLDNGTSPSATAAQAAGLTGIVNPQLPVVNITQTTGFGFGWLYNNPQFAFPILGTGLTWVKGSHTFKFGGDYVKNVISLDPFAFYSAGNYNFSPLETGLPGYSATGYGYSSFLLGQVDNATLEAPQFVRTSDSGFGAYAQDQWRVTSHLTINYGLRWDGVRYPYEHNNNFSPFDPNLPNPGAGGLPGAIVFYGNNHTPSNGLTYIVNPNYKLFDPRLGITYRINDSTVVRAYYGIIDVPGFALWTNWPTYGAFPVATPASTNNGVTPGFDWDQGFKGSVAPNYSTTVENGNAVYEFNPKVNENGRTQAMGLSFERTLPWGFAAKAEYLGKFTHGLFYIYNVPYPSVNQIPLSDLSLGSVLDADINSPQAAAAGIKTPYAGFTGSVAQALRPFPQYLDITNENVPAGYQEWNAGHFSLQKRFGTSGLSMLLDYTVSKLFSANQFQEGMYQQQAHQLAPVDETNVVILSYDYALPFGRGKMLLGGASGFMQELVGGWDVAGINTYHSGTPIVVTTEATNPGVQNVWPVLNPGVPILTGTGCSSTVPGTAKRYLNINAFSSPAPFTMGDINTTNARSCGYANEDLSVSKKFALTEKVDFKFGMYFFNVLNRHYFSGLGTDINNTATFGTFSAASAPRLIQLNARFIF